MSGPLFWEDVTEGMELPPLVKNPTTRQLVQYAGASGDFNEIHYDRSFAQSEGLQDLLLQGALKNAFLGQLITDWTGEWGDLKKLSCQYRGMDFPGRPIIAKGTVARKYRSNGEHLVECTIWLEDSQGQQNTRAAATVALPSRQDTLPEAKV